MASKKSKPSKKESGMDAAFEALTEIPKIDHRPEGDGWFNLEEYIVRIKANGIEMSDHTARRQLNKLAKTGKLEKKIQGAGGMCWYGMKQD